MINELKLNITIKRLEGTYGDADKFYFTTESVETNSVGKAKKVEDNLVKEIAQPFVYMTDHLNSIIEEEVNKLCDN